jgi:hypothetical protein
VTSGQTPALAGGKRALLDSIDVTTLPVCAIAPSSS